ncbi:cysteine-rich CWC family protein [Chitinophaga sp. 30R24]|uniref:cysteine-rich CWC family protein n=1 Tax=Chitinophaga sp. 30R24 TaxID=3248838 RepID=UPI003B91AA7E
MASHETITCPRCKQTFECRVGTILRCQCQNVVLTDEERTFIRQQYNECLCANCLRQLKIAYQQLPDTSK